ncbi:lipocalin-like domain-containing protein [Mycobacterium angelicum]|nr:lipocalin-like domain-containing protein [Mycobacterium angelicum]MCV7200351.1 lipocalin-like domain-containing protein [Mycobacterium angelicum]
MSEALRDKVVGAWKLVSYVERDSPDGPARYPHGEDAQGLIMYTPDGFMSAQIQSTGRPNYDRPVASGGTTEQAAAAALGYLAYSGRYFVDEASGDIRHEAMLSLVPNYLGQFHLRHSDLDGDRLTLSSELTLPDGRTVHSSLLWVRAAVEGGRVVGA